MEIQNGFLSRFERQANMVQLLAGQLEAMKVELEQNQEEVNQLQLKRKEVAKALNVAWSK